METPLSAAFFSTFNRETIQKLIRDAVKAQTGWSIGQQSDLDLQTFMRVVYTDLVRDPYSDMKNQIEGMNAEVVSRAKDVVISGILQQLVYLRDISENPTPLAAPASVSTHGNKIPSNFKFGIF